MPDFDTMEEWQEFFSANFPEGVLITIAESSPDLSAFDSSPQMLSVKINVREVTGINPEVVFVNYEDESVHAHDIAAIEEEDPERMVLRTTEDLYLVFSNKLSPLQKHSVKKRLEGGIWA